MIEWSIAMPLNPNSHKFWDFFVAQICFLFAVAKIAQFCCCCLRSEKSWHFHFWSLLPPPFSSVNQRFWLFIARQWYLICSHEGSDIIIIITRTLLSPKTNFKINSSFQQFCRNPSKFLRLQPVSSSSLSSAQSWFRWLWKSENSTPGRAMKDRDCQL